MRSPVELFTGAVFYIDIFIKSRKEGGVSMKKRLLAYFMASIMVIGLLPASALAYEAPEDESAAGSVQLLPAAPVEETGAEENALTAVPTEKLIFDKAKGVIKGIDADWLAKNKDKPLSVAIPAKINDTPVTSIGQNAFNGKKVVAVDFSNATNLEKIDNQAFMHSPVASVDLSNTKVTTIGKFAFGDCTSLKDVILPSTLTELGSSVFTDCKFVESIRLADSPEGVVFALPEGLTSIGYQCFKNCFADGVEAKVVIPASVATLGEGAFYDKHITQIIINKKHDAFSGGSVYDSSAIRIPNGTNCMIIFPDKSTYESFTGYSSTERNAMTYPVEVKFFISAWQSEYHLNDRLLGYQKNANTGFWEFDDSYALPEAPASSAEQKPGYDYISGWSGTDGANKAFTLQNDEPLHVTPRSDGSVSVKSGQGTYVLQNPTISYLVDGKSKPVDADQPFTVTIGDGKEHSIGIQVDHPLLKEKQGTDKDYVYFEYYWFDEVALGNGQNTLNGPRSKEEPERFSTALSNVDVLYVDGKHNTIPITKAEHARYDGSSYKGYNDYYLVVVFGYHVVNGDKINTPFYLSANNGIGTGNANVTDGPHLLQVNVDEVRIITATAGDNGKITPAGEVAVPKGKNQTFKITPNEGYHIQDVKVDRESVGAVKEYTFTEVDKPHTIHATFARNSSGGGGSTTYTLSYVTNGGKAIPSESKNNSWVKAYKSLPIPTRVGYRFDAWYTDAKLTKEVTGDVKVNSRQVTLYAGWTASTVPEMLNGKDHYSYIKGYTDGMIHPNTPVTRAQVATILFRLLDEDLREKYLTETNTFRDVNADHWANTAVSTMAKMGVFRGRTLTRFDPDAPITRGEFAAVCARLDKTQVQVTNSFTDLNGYWAKQEILRAAALGWVQGYEDGSYRPNARITRAQVITMINRVLCRMPEKSADLLSGMTTWKDCTESDWFYLAVQEATNSHDFQRKPNSIYERWAALRKDPDWSRYER